MPTRRVAVLVLLGFWTPHPSTAQSLEEAAAREAARRRQARGNRSYTNQDLPKATPLPKGEGVESAPASPPPEPTESPRSEADKPAPGPKASPTRTEAEWRQAADAARSAVETAKARLKVAEDKRAGADQALSTATALAHQGRPEALLVVLEEGKQASQEAEEAKTALAAAEAALERLAAEASEQGVPDSWWADPKSP